VAVPVKQSVQVTFAGGVDTKTDPKQVGPASFLVLNNMISTTGGELVKRNGYAGLGTTITTPSPILSFSSVPAALNSARKVFSYDNELLVNDALNLYSYDESLNAWNYKGRSTAVSLATQSIISNASEFVSCDSSIDSISGIKVFAAEHSIPLATVIYSIQDIATGQFIVNQANFDASSVVGYTRPRVIAIGGKSWIFAVEQGTGDIYYLPIVGQTVGIVTALGISVNAAFSNYDVDVDPHTGNIYIAYNDTTSQPSISLLDSSLAVVSNETVITESATHGISWFGDGTNIWVVYNDGSATKAFAVNNAVTATTGTPGNIDTSALATNVNNVTGVWSSVFGKAFIFYDPVTESAGITQTAAINYNTATIVAGAVVGANAGIGTLFIGSLNINSKAFAVNGIPHVVGLYSYYSLINELQNGPVGSDSVWVATDQIPQATNFLLNLYNVTPSMGGAAFNDVTANIAGKISPGEASQTAPFPGVLAGVHQSSAGVWELALLHNSNFAFQSISPYTPFISPTGVIDVKFDFNLTNTDMQLLGNNANIAGAAVLMYDSSRVVEQNFHIYPNSLASTPSNSGGHMGLASSNSTYSYIYTYEWIDNQGQVHRSFPSPVVTPIASGQTYTFASGTVTGGVTITVPYLRVTNKGGNQVFIQVYRTLANGSVYYNISDIFTAFPNDPSKDSFTINDVAKDQDIEGNIQIYTTGAQGYYAPPATDSLASYKNRLINVASEDPYQFGYSNQVQQNFPVQFVPFFLQNIGTVGGPIVTTANMDDKIIIFKGGTIYGPAIWYLVGQGPAPSGQGNDFTDPLPVAVDAGCVDRASVVLTPVGLMFKSSKGIYLISRALEAVYIGAPVEEYNSYAVVSAQLIPNTTQVRFLLSGGAPVSTLMYDYYYKRWSTFTNPTGISDCIFQGQHTYVSSTGQAYQEAPGTYVDLATPVLMNFTTSWIKLAGLQGYQRAFFFYLLADYLSAHQLQLQIAYDFSVTPAQTTIITPSLTDALENWRVFLAKQRCQAFQISLQEIYGGTPGAGFSMSGLNLIVGVKSSFRTISAAQSVG
jgi:hypothetical protein